MMDPSYGHEVVRQPFYFGVTEVTMAQFRRFIEASGHLTDVERYGTPANPANPAGYAWHSPGFLVENDDCPVVWVSWNDCIAYCDWLSRSDKQTYRLPTITEWIWASRAGHVGREYHGGQEELLETAWIRDNSNLRTHPVRQLRPNAWGLWDTLGNVSEWTWDRFGPDRVMDPHDVPGRPPSAGAVIGNNIRSSSSSWRVVGNNPDPTHGHAALGFRIVCELRHPQDAR
jgi:formylglycine-generating enzyme required for sulfatase activity